MLVRRFCICGVKWVGEISTQEQQDWFEDYWRKHHGGRFHKDTDEAGMKAAKRKAKDDRGYGA